MVASTKEQHAGRTARGGPYQQLTYIGIQGDQDSPLLAGDGEDFPVGGPHHAQRRHGDHVMADLSEQACDLRMQTFVQEEPTRRC